MIFYYFVISGKTKNFWLGMIYNTTQSNFIWQRNGRHASTVEQTGEWGPRFPWPSLTEDGWHFGIMNVNGMRSFQSHKDHRYVCELWN